ncbi:MAG: efflux RND transporter periplasmic adaptor subunit [Bdellovibrionales bacterium]|nr:efflux RND transporter periplasmic adaptor subunit [Bdellovibrionales bacterium]
MKTWKWALLCAAVLGAAGAFWIYRPAGAGSFASLQRGHVVEAVYAMGTVTARNTWQLKVGVLQRVEKVFRHEGEAVEKGDALLEVTGLPVFRAPIPGVVTRVGVKPGESAVPQQALLSVVDLRDRYIKVALEQQGALRVKKGQKVRLSFESLRGERFEGEVGAVYPDEGQFLVHIEAPRLPEAVLPGMTADVAIEIAEKKDVNVVPVAAVTNGRLVVRRGHGQVKLPVKLGTIDGEWAELLEGDVRPDDKILLQDRK